MFIIYQVNIFLKLSQVGTVVKSNKSKLIRGTHVKQASFYSPNSMHKFVCIKSLEEISFHRINDDYCDCLDGSDEPGTSACDNGIFYCDIQVKFDRYPLSISSMKVNDGICDCCDGSDEWDNQVLVKLSGEFCYLQFLKRKQHGKVILSFLNHSN